MESPRPHYLDCIDYFISENAIKGFTTQAKAVKKLYYTFTAEADFSNKDEYKEYENQLLAFTLFTEGVIDLVGNVGSEKDCFEADYKMILSDYLDKRYRDLDHKLA